MDETDRMIMNRIFDKFDKIEEEIAEVSSCQQDIRNKVNNYLDSQEKKGQRKEKVFYIIIAAIGGIYSVLDLVKNQWI